MYIHGENMKHIKNWVFEKPEDSEIRALIRLKALVETLESYTEREKMYKSTILTPVNYFLGIDDVVEEIVIKAENDKGEKYVIVI